MTTQRWVTSWWEQTWTRPLGAHQRTGTPQRAPAARLPAAAQMAAAAQHAAAAGSRRAKSQRGLFHRCTRLFISEQLPCVYTHKGAIDRSLIEQLKVATATSTSVDMALDRHSELHASAHHVNMQLYYSFSRY